jgi:hypothetical protein
MRNETAMDPKITYASARASLMSDAENSFLCGGLEARGIPSGFQPNDQDHRWANCWKAAAFSGVFEGFSDVQ